MLLTNSSSILTVLKLHLDHTIQGSNLCLTLTVYKVLTVDLLLNAKSSSNFQFMGMMTGSDPELQIENENNKKQDLNFC